VLLESIRGFTGLERRLVVLTGIDELPADDKTTLLSCRHLSRAREPARYCHRGDDEPTPPFSGRVGRTPGYRRGSVRDHRMAPRKLDPEQGTRIRPPAGRDYVPVQKWRLANARPEGVGSLQALATLWVLDGEVPPRKGPT